MAGASDQTQERRNRVIRSRPEDRRPNRPIPTKREPAGDVTAPLELDRLIHERMRLGIIAALAVHDSRTFGDLKQLLRMTDGNLSVHARRLEEAGYVTCSKSFDGRTPRTEYRITTEGRTALEHYIGHMESLIRAVRQSEVHPD
jgi:DNA-binding MarR family transcriptional regulator